METVHLGKRVLVFVVGLFVVALGVALSVKANLGVSPISCVPYIFSRHYPVSMGVTTIILNVLLILLQILVRRRNYDLVQLGQLSVVVLFGFFTDLALYLVSGLSVTGYWIQLLYCLLSLVIIAFGIFLEVIAKVTYLPGEGMAMALAETFPVEFGLAKIGVDCSLVVVGVISSFLLFGALLGIREGTVLAALAVGALVRVYRKVFVRF